MKNNIVPSPFNLLPESARVEKTFQKGELIFREGDPTIGIYFLFSGSVELKRTTSNGTDIVIHTSNELETFAEASLFSDTYHCDALVLEPSKIILIKKQAVLNLASTNPDFSRSLMKNFALQIQKYRRKIEILAVGNAKERVLLGMYEGFLKNDIKSFSSELNLTHETVYRALASLADEGLIKKTSRGKYIIEET